MAELDPDQETALRRLRAAFGFVEVLKVINHNDGRTRTTTSPSSRASRHAVLLAEAVDPSTAWLAPV
jgi:hypothetical protein